MFERFTERARQVVVLAQEESRALKHNYIGTEHILLGLLREEEGIAAAALERLDITAEVVRTQVVALVGSGTEGSVGQIPFTPRTKKVLELALREALNLGHNYIGTEHILLGLVRENEGVACRIMLDLGADADRIRSAVGLLLTESGAFEPPAEPDPATRPSATPTVPDPTAAQQASLSAQELDALIEQLIAEKRVIERRLHMLQADIDNARAERDAQPTQSDEPGA